MHKPLSAFQLRIVLVFSVLKKKHKKVACCKVAHHQRNFFFTLLKVFLSWCDATFVCVLHEINWPDFDFATLPALHTLPLHHHRLSSSLNVCLLPSCAPFNLCMPWEPFVLKACLLVILWLWLLVSSLDNNVATNYYVRNFGGRLYRLGTNCY